MVRVITDCWYAAIGGELLATISFFAERRPAERMVAINERFEGLAAARMRLRRVLIAEIC